MSAQTRVLQMPSTRRGPTVIEYGLIAMYVAFAAYVTSRLCAPLILLRLLLK